MRIFTNKDIKTLFIGVSLFLLCNTILSQIILWRFHRNSPLALLILSPSLSLSMLSEQYVSLNDLYYAIGLPDIKLGEALGWNIDKGYIDVQFGTHLAANGTPCLVLAFNVAPQYGYNILSLS